jgi:hypothetical protein
MRQAHSHGAASGPGATTLVASGLNDAIHIGKGQSDCGESIITAIASEWLIIGQDRRAFWPMETINPRKLDSHGSYDLKSAGLQERGEQTCRNVSTATLRISVR